MVDYVAHVFQSKEEIRICRKKSGREGKVKSVHTISLWSKFRTYWCECNKSSWVGIKLSLSIRRCKAVPHPYLIPGTSDDEDKSPTDTDYPNHNDNNWNHNKRWNSRTNGGKRIGEYVGRSQTESALQQKKLDQNLTGFLDSMLVGYDKRIRPNNGDIPIRTNISVFVNSFYSINEQTMDYKINIFLRLRWNDPRLAHNFTSKPMVLHPSLLSNIWKPDVYFSNEKHANFHMITTENKLVRVFQNGDIYSSVRITLTLSCNMHLRHFPMDVQVCNMAIESFGYDMSSLVFNWNEQNPIQLPKTLQLPQFIIRGYKVKNCTKVYNDVSFTCLEADFILQRQMGYYIIQMYAPSSLIVILSWVAFWINMDAAPARTALGITTVLTLATQSSGARASLPKVSYVKAIDVWFAVCLVFVFATLLEYALVNFLSRQTKRVFTKWEYIFSNIEPRRVEGERGCPLDRIGEDVKIEDNSQKERRQKCNHKKAKAIDRVSRILFPGIFLLFNVCYWVIYQANRDDLARALEGATLYHH